MSPSGDMCVAKLSLSKIDTDYESVHVFNTPFLFVHFIPLGRLLLLTKSRHGRLTAGRIYYSVKYQISIIFRINAKVL